MHPPFLANYTTAELEASFASSLRRAVLLPVGSVEPHGPHLPLSTDTIISEVACMRAAKALLSQGFTALVAPAIPYGVTDFARGFAGAISISASVLTAFIEAVVKGLLENGARHVCVVNNHLEPAHDKAVRDAVTSFKKGTTSVASPLTRRWGRLLSDEYKRGACHAGQYETSLVLAARPDLVDEECRKALPALETSLSEGIKAGRIGFREMGLEQAYTGAPASASAGEGNELFEALAQMIVTEVLEAHNLLETSES